MLENRSDLIAQFAGAELATDALTGATIAKSFGDRAAEYRAIRTGVALLDRSMQALLRIAGPDCKTFLQGYVTNNVAKLEPGQGCLNGVANQVGKTIADCRTYALEDSVLIECDPWARARLLQHVGKYAPFSKSKLEDISESCGVLSLQGPESQSLLEALSREALGTLAAYTHRVIRIDDVDIRACKITHTGEEGFDLSVPAEHVASLWRSLTEGREGLRARPAGSDAAEIARIEAAIPRLGIDFDENNVFLESGLDDAVSYAKGCYLGQEIIARIYFRGHVSKRLATIILASGPVPSPGDRVFSGEKEAGKITRACLSPTLGKPLAFAMIKYDFLATGTQLEVKTADGQISAEVVCAPFAWERMSIEPPKDFVARTMPVAK